MVKYDSARPAEECIKVMNGRYFDQRRLEAFFWDGIIEYSVRATEEEEEERIKSFGDFLDGGEDETGEEPVPRNLMNDEEEQVPSGSE